MPQCKGCGQTTVWNKQHQQQTGKWVPHDPQSGLPHDCPAYNKEDKCIDTKPQEREEGAQVPATAGPSRYDSAYLIPKEDWQLILDNGAKVTAQLEHLSEFYDSVMQEIEAIRNIVYEQQIWYHQQYQKQDHKESPTNAGYRKHQEQLAAAEQQYDQDKEEGFG